MTWTKRLEAEMEEKPHLLSKFWMSLKYEHSLLGLHRFDSHFYRVQRVAVFVAVVITNFFVSALLFELRNPGTGVSFSFIFLVAFASALIVPLPVKLVINLLFRSTEIEIGSRYDIAGNLYKVLTRVEDGDGLESKTYRVLIDAYRDLAAASFRSRL